MLDLSSECKRELSGVLNKHGVDTAANMADWILTNYVAGCIITLIVTEHERREHEGYPPSPEMAQ